MSDPNLSDIDFENKMAWVWFLLDDYKPKSSQVFKLFLVEAVAAKFFKFIQGFNVEEGYMNTYRGDIGLKIESEDIIDNSGLTVLHPYYSNITLLPFK